MYQTKGIIERGRGERGNEGNGSYSEQQQQHDDATPPLNNRYHVTRSQLSLTQQCRVPTVDKVYPYYVIDW